MSASPPSSGTNCNVMPSNAFTNMLSAMRMPDNKRLNTTRSQ